jgi:kinesin family protein 4/21/27
VSLTRSSRSHAIFTITLDQRRVVTGPSTPGTGPASGSSSAVNGSGRAGGEDEDDEGDEGAAGGGKGELALDNYLAAKMHLVDLAGSERAKRTMAEGARLEVSWEAGEGEG